MVSLRIIIINMLLRRNFPKCIVKIGKNTSSVPYIVSAENTDCVTIGNYCSIGHGTTIITHQGHIPPKEFRDYRVSTYPLAIVRKHGFLPRYWIRDRKNFVTIGNDVWTGINAIIMPGVTVGDGAIIGAGSLVTHDVPPYAVVAGVPAKLLNFRYTNDQIQKLLKIAWWNWSEKNIVANMDYFYGKVDEFIDRFYEKNAP
jgi:acetyltransferase-like isoleucine patch superfamily enzyme